MSEKDRVIRHLEMIQGVVNRLGSNSLMLKGWSMTIIAAAIILMARMGNWIESAAQQADR